MSSKNRLRIKWFLSVFMIFFFGGLTTFYFTDIVLNAKSMTFLGFVALITGIGSAFTGPDFTKLLKDSKTKKDRAKNH